MGNLQIRFLLILFGIGKVGVGRSLRQFQGSQGTLELHHTLHVARTTGGGTSVHCQHARQRTFHRLHATVDVTDSNNLLNILNFSNFLNFLHISYLIQPQFFCYLRAHLRGVAVNGLTTADNQIHIGTYVLDGRCQGITGGESVGTGKCAVGKQIATVGTAIHGLAYHLCGTPRAHGQHLNSRAGEFVFQSESLLQCVQVLGIEDGRQCATVHRAFGSHGVGPYVARVGHLLGKYNNFQFHSFLSYIYYYIMYKFAHKGTK